MVDRKKSPINKTLEDRTKISLFKSKVEQMKDFDGEDEEKILTILHEALEILNITDEPIDKYYDMGDVIGSGKYGLVRIAYSKLNLKVAIKTIKLAGVTTKYHIIAQEILTLKRVDHPNIVKMHEIYRDKDKLYLVFEYVEGKELFDFIFDRNRLKESEAASIIKQLLQCINHMNSLNICHRDLKLENIVINPLNKQIKVLDFGFS